MKLLKSPISWGVLLGVVVGYFGIPVLNPGGSNDWVWHQPCPFRTGSILICATLGCLLGLFFHFWMWKGLDKKSAMWIAGLFSLTLVVGTIGVYRYQASNESAMWTQVNLGFVRTVGVSRQNLTMSNTKTDRALGTQIVQAGADIGAAEQFDQNRYPKLDTIASALSEAGYYMVTQENKEKFQESVRFVNQAGSIIKHETGNQSYSDKTQNFDEIISEISGDIPNDFDEGWPAN